MMDIGRSQPGPEKLLGDLEYSNEDVRNALHRDFLGKCYLCETRLEPGCFEVDHRFPRGEDGGEELTTCWENLFLSCRYCNGARSKSWPIGGLLDPSAEGEDERVEKRLDQRLVEDVQRPGRYRPVFAAVDPSDTEAGNSARELTNLHAGLNNDGSAKRNQGPTNSLRSAINDQASLLFNRLYRLALIELGASASPVEAETLRLEVRELLSRSAPFTMLLRSLITDHPLVAAMIDDEPPDARRLCRGA